MLFSFLLSVHPVRPPLLSKQSNSFQEEELNRDQFWVMSGIVSTGHITENVRHKTDFDMFF
jgi:hypothetical protein